MTLVLKMDVGLTAQYSSADDLFASVKKVDVNLLT